jgi:hypothetical protein
VNAAGRTPTAVYSSGIAARLYSIDVSDDSVLGSAQLSAQDVPND